MRWLLCMVPVFGIFDVAFIGNSLTGGKSVGGTPKDGDCLVPWPQPPPTKEIYNPGDVPTKVRLLADTAKQWALQERQNTRGSYSLHAHATDCQQVNEHLTQDADVVVIQPMSDELRMDDCSPREAQIADLNSLIRNTKPGARLFLVETWAYYDYYSEEGEKAEICFFEQVNCTTARLAEQLDKRMEVLPVGSAFRALADAACKEKTSPDYECTHKVLPFGGYVTASCDSIWGLSQGGAFVDNKHQSDEVGAWLVAAVVFGALNSPPCLPPPSLLQSLHVEEFAALTAAARLALQGQYGPSPLPECPVA